MMLRPAHRLACAMVALLPSLTAAGCAAVGPQRLDMDQMGYAAALGDGLKRQMLLNMVRLRYADVPAFVSATQLISGYTLQSTGQLGLNAYPNANPGNYATVSGTVQYSTRPTFTFTPVTGERFAQSYLRPLAPAELLSLAQSGAPIDLLFRIGVQSVNGLPNAATRIGDAQGPSDGFQALMGALREVQAAGAVGLRFERQPANGRVHLLLDGDDPRAKDAALEVRRLLGVGPAATELEVVYGRGRREPGQVAVLTRSVLQILYELGSQVEVPEADLHRGEAQADRAGAAADGSPPPTATRLVHVRQGRSAPSDAYAAVSYRGRWFWIEAGDYRSKAAFAFVHILQTLAESNHGQPTPVVTIPAQ
ncbi:MAG: hypothetical protein ICV73_29985 [Acetobacteraceae bacterium]|nr:hypothetical protein [Acetobacteraceae bacterium]